MIVARRSADRLESILCAGGSVELLLTSLTYAKRSDASRPAEFLEFLKDSERSTERLSDINRSA
jgi:hypothetical protein